MYSSALKTVRQTQKLLNQSTQQQLNSPALYEQICQSLQKAKIHFLEKLSSFMYRQDFLIFLRELKIQKIQSQTKLIQKGMKMTNCYVLLDGRVEYNYHFQNSQITEVIGRACIGHLICSDFLVSGKNSFYSVATVSESYLITISLQNFTKYAKKCMAKELDQKIDFLKKTIIFSDVPEEIIRKYIFSFFPEVYKFKESLYHEQEAADCVYLIEEGEIQLRKKIIENLQNQTKAMQQTKRNGEIKMVTLSRGQFFGSVILKNNQRKQGAFCLSQSVKVWVINKLIFNEMYFEGGELKKNIDFHLQRIQKIHEGFVAKHSVDWQKRAHSDKKFRKKKRKNKIKQIGLEEIKWWGLAEKVKISEKYRMPKRNILKVSCSRNSNQKQNDIDRISMEKKIDQLKKRILKGELDDLNFNESIFDEQNNVGNCNFNPSNTAMFPKTKIKIKMLDVKPKAIDLAEVTKKKLLAYAKNLSNFCDRLNLQ